MIGWYVHHHGSGHLHRARAVRAALDIPVTVLSSLPRPEDWDDPWIVLESDDLGSAQQADAGGRLHWAPVHHAGLRGRMAAISSWIHSATPDLMVCDVSVEVVLLSRLHGVPVLSVVMPGDRSDEPHRLAYDLASVLVGCWPPEAQGLFCSGANGTDGLRLVGGLSRFPVREPGARRPGPPRVTVLMGEGGTEVSSDMIDLAMAQSQEWKWTVLGRDLGTWLADPYDAVCDADVVVAHAGENALAEVAAARRPAVIVPCTRPHGEQAATAGALMRGTWPASVRWRWPTRGWSSLLQRTAALDGGAWASWCDGGAQVRFAEIITQAIAGVSPEVA